MKKLLLSLVLGASVVMASDMPNEDLLSVATQGKVKGTQFEMGKAEMQKADGGYYYSYRGIGSYYWNINTRSTNSRSSRSSIYARAWGSYYWGRRYN